MVGELEPIRLKVAAPNLSHPIAPPLFQKAVFSYCDPLTEREGVRGSLKFIWDRVLGYWN